MLIHPLTVPGWDLVLVNLCMENSSVDHLLLSWFGAAEWRLASCPGENLRGSGANHDVEVGRLQQAALALSGGIGALLVAVEVVGRVGGLTSGRGPVQKTGKLLGDAALSAVLQGRSRVSLIGAVVCWEEARDKETRVMWIQSSGPVKEIVRLHGQSTVAK